MKNFQLKSAYAPSGDQPEAIRQLTEGVKRGEPAQVLLGVTGSGKTFTVANVIAQVGKPTLVLSHNKTLAAQLYTEFKAFFPDNAVEYYVSYYDYYQPEAYIASTDTYIEKDLAINEDIDKLRLAATSSLLSRHCRCLSGLRRRTYPHQLLGRGNRRHRGSRCAHGPAAQHVRRLQNLPRQSLPHLQGNAGTGHPPNPGRPRGANCRV